MKISKRVEGVEYAIRDIALSARKLEKEVTQLIQQLRDGELLVINEQEVSNVQFKK